MPKKRKCFYIKARPKKPVRKKDIPFYHDISSGDSFDIIKTWLQNLELTNGPISQVTFNSTHSGYCYDCGNDGVNQVVATAVESPAEFAKRLKNYEEDLAAYNKWKKEHKTEIEEELKLRKEEALEAEKLKIQAEAKMLERQKKAYERNLKQVQEKLNNLGK